MTHYIYIPGLGGSFDLLRRLALLGWRRPNTTVTFVSMNWDDTTENWQQKYTRVKQAMKAARDDKVVLVGESAGGAMALYAFIKNGSKYCQAITICGYNHGAADVDIGHKTAHPAFYRLVPKVDKALRGLSKDQRTRITTLYSMADKTVRPGHSRIIGAPAIVQRSGGHLRTIGRVLVSPNIIFKRS